MEEFSPGKSLHTKKTLYGSRNAPKKRQLRADVRLKIKHRLQRDKETRIINNAGVISKTANSNDENILVKPTTQINNRLSKVIEKLWCIKHDPHLNCKKFVYAGCMPCFLRRNIDKVNRRLKRRTKQFKKIDNLFYWQRRKRKQKVGKEFYFRFKHVNGKRPAGTIPGQKKAKRLCTESKDRNGKEDLKTTDKQNYNEDYSNSFPVETDYNSGTVMFGDDEVSQTEITVSGVLTNEKEAFPSTSQPRNDESVTQKARASSEGIETTSDKENLNSEFTMKLKNHKPFDQKEKCSGIFETKFDKKNLNPSSRLDKMKLLSNEEMHMKAFRVSLMDCFATGLRERQYTSCHSFPTTSTPKRKATRVNTTSPRAPNCKITLPERELHCADEERTALAQEVDFEREHFRGTLKNAMSITENMTYKPLFSNSPRLWKSVVVEND